MAIANGIFKQLVAKKQSALGTKATAGSAQYYRRVTSSLDLAKETYKSNEIVSHLQRNDFRHGVNSVGGTISGELSGGSYQGFIESAFRAAASTAVTSGALTTVAAAVTSGASGTFTRSSGSWLTDGFKIGMVVNSTGWATTGVPNNNHYSVITALTSTVMTVTMLDGVAVGAKAAGDSVTFVTPGKYVSIPTSGHTRDYWTFEHNFSDITQSEQFIDCAIGGVNVKLPATGMATVDFPIVGLKMETSSSAYFTSPTAASSTSIFAAVNGSAYIAGAKVGLITGMDISVNANVQSIGGVVGSNFAPDVTSGSFDVSGNMTVLLQDATFRDYFVNETEVSVNMVLTAGSTANAHFMAINMPRVKVGGATKDDGEKSIVMTMPFTALYNSAGGTGTNGIQTSITIQDSQFV